MIIANKTSNGACGITMINRMIIILSKSFYFFARLFDLTDVITSLSTINYISSKYLCGEV